MKLKQGSLLRMSLFAGGVLPLILAAYGGGGGVAQMLSHRQSNAPSSNEYDSTTNKRHVD